MARSFDYDGDDGYDDEILVAMVVMAMVMVMLMTMLLVMPMRLWSLVISDRGSKGGWTATLFHHFPLETEVKEIQSQLEKLQAAQKRSIFAEWDLLTSAERALLHRVLSRRLLWATHIVCRCLFSISEVEFRSRKPASSEVGDRG